MSVSHVGRLLAFGAIAGLFVAAQISAAEPQENPHHKMNQHAQSHDGSHTIGSVPSKKIVGATVQNPNGDKIGSIEDIVIDTDSNRVVYAALGVGGVMGMGEKLFAVPMEQLKFSRDSSNNPVFVLDVTKERLEKAPGFDKSNWPDFAKPEWRTQVDEYYRQK